MTCYERLRKQIQDKESYDRLQSYFNAVDNEKLDEYHKQHGRGDKNKKLY